MAFNLERVLVGLVLIASTFGIAWWIFNAITNTFGWLYGKRKSRNNN
jgi:hypothetical protein